MNHLKFYFAICLAFFSLFFFKSELKSQPAVNLINPPAAASCVNVSCTFTWNATGGTILNYELQVSSSSSFTSFVVDQPGLNSATFTATLPSNNQIYFWRVIGYFQGGNQATSPTRQLITKDAPPSQITPVNNLNCVNNNTTFQWQNIVGTQDYILQVSTSNTFLPPYLVLNVDTLSSNTFTAQMPTQNTDYYWRIKASMSVSCQTDWSPVWKFTTGPNPPAPATPALGAKGITFNPLLYWNVSTGASSYSLEVDDDPNFAQPLIVSTAGLTSTTYSLNLPSVYNRQYYWHVKCFYPSCVSDWSTTFNFKTAYEPAVLVQPADGSKCIDLSSTFIWNPVPGASQYRLQVSDTSDFSRLIVNKAQIDAPFDIVSLTSQLKTYYWRVRGEDINNTGIWSSSASFTTTISPTTLQFPDSGLVGMPLKFNFVWKEDFPGALYKLQVSTNSDFLQPLTIDVTNLPDPNYTANLPSNNKEYFWRVATIYTGCTSSWSKKYSFKTIIAPPKLMSPVDSAANVSLKPVFVWLPSEGAYSFEINVSTDATFTNIIQGKRGIAADRIQFLEELPVGTKLWWRARAANNDGTSVWSEVFVFMTGGQGADVPILVSPVNNSIKVAVPVNLVWQPSSGVKTYHVQVSKNENFLGFILNSATIANSSTTVTGLAHYTNYYWRVSAINDSGESKWSTVWKFRTTALIPADPPLLWTPVDNVKNTPVDLIFSWYPVGGAEGYHLQVSKDGNFTQYPFVVDDSIIYVTSEKVYDFSYDTPYYWRVLGWNEAGRGPWSDTWVFTTKIYVSVDDNTDAPFSTKIMPNPFGESSIIIFSLPYESYTIIKVYNTLGNEVGTIAEKYMNAGENKIVWEPQNLRNGIYLLSIQSGSNHEMKRIVLMK